MIHNPLLLLLKKLFSQSRMNINQPGRLQLTEEQKEDFRKECGAFIVRWLEQGLCTEELAQEYRDDLEFRINSYTDAEGQEETFEQDLEICRKENDEIAKQTQ
ncbi:UNKNOWN [Stylonychia lemnae]|uniref:Uncharacterized protein n=1 Tax=Stylonychia lemnae TaxID=5949 RepID=A0A078AHJ9_STYLE|nr:UNKNOWN [Stylonychia lemnae]|eukprot:CDW81341.1 UNKNOWN [Stylonychia lemnae]